MPAPLRVPVFVLYQNSDHFLAAGFHFVEPGQDHRQMRLMNRGDQANITELEAPSYHAQFVKKVLDLLAEIHLFEKQKPESRRLEEQYIVEFLQRPVAAQAVQHLVKPDDYFGKLTFIFRLQEQ